MKITVSWYKSLPTIEFQPKMLPAKLFSLKKLSNPEKGWAPLL
jgi:hypothetical protein